MLWERVGKDGGGGRRKNVGVSPVVLDHDGTESDQRGDGNETTDDVVQPTSQGDFDGQKTLEVCLSPSFIRKF